MSRCCAIPPPPDDQLVAVAAELMTTIGGIKARGDHRAADELLKHFVDGSVVPHATIAERCWRVPKASFVYAVVR